VRAHCRLQAALNGDREHPALPRTPSEIAADAAAAVAEGAQVVHLHPYDDQGRQTFAAEPCAAAIRAVRAACPGVPISLSTSAEIDPDPRRRYDSISRWTEPPDLVSANQGEAGITELCELLVRRGIGIEAGLLRVDDARAFVASGLADSCVRVLVEPLDNDPEQAVADAATMERLLAEAEIDLEQVHHGDQLASWAVNRWAIPRGHGIRTGLEDTPVLPDGQLAAGNAELVAAAAALLRSTPET
jgi:uncharacterized protein (DUF849 family)